MNTDSKNRLIWIDLEMTGLEVEKERIIEIAVIVTDSQLNIIAESPDLVIHQPESVLAAMDDWNRQHHGDSGLTDQVRQSTLDEATCEKEILDFLSQHCQAATCPLAGNSIHQDRKFLSKYMPALERFCHYRNVDVSTVKELVRRWYPDAYERRPAKTNQHRALEDIRQSIDELRFYRQVAFRQH